MRTRLIRQSSSTTTSLFVVMCAMTHPYACHDWCVHVSRHIPSCATTHSHKGHTGRSPASHYWTGNHEPIYIFHMSRSPASQNRTGDADGGPVSKVRMYESRTDLYIYGHEPIYIFHMSRSPASQNRTGDADGGPVGSAGDWDGLWYSRAFAPQNVSARGSRPWCQRCECMSVYMYDKWIWIHVCVMQCTCDSKHFSEGVTTLIPKGSLPTHTHTHIHTHTNFLSLSLSLSLTHTYTHTLSHTHT